MYEFIKGTIDDIESNYIIINNNNIGYKIYTPSPYSFNIGEEYKVYVYQYVRVLSYTSSSTLSNVDYEGLGFIMNINEIIPRLNEVFRDVFDDTTIIVNEETTSDDIEDWDSLAHINLVAAVENEFCLRFKMREVSSMKNVGDMINIISERGK